MLVFFMTAFYAVESPVNMEITHPGAYVLLDWGTVAGASSYKIYSCDTPYGDYELDETGIFPTLTSWTKLEPAAKQFYNVTAVKVPITVDLGTAANFVILAKAAISSVPACAITGNVGISPASGRSNPDFVNLGSGDISGLTLVPGIYKWRGGIREW
ncbi:MAG: hypothetical protein RBS43_05745 [Candidatus Cloacimonas sp.]|jgi:hypothetical protein|nr:hypothetical protein [Candidatus Cloacimonas sp.]